MTRYRNVNADARMLSWQCTSTLRSRAPFITALNSSKSSYVGCLPVHGDVDVRRAVLGDELAFVGDGALIVRRREVHDELEALLAERGERRGVGLAGRVQALGRGDVVDADRRGRGWRLGQARPSRAMRLARARRSVGAGGPWFGLRADLTRMLAVRSAGRQRAALLLEPPARRQHPPRRREADQHERRASCPS